MCQLITTRLNASFDIFPHPSYRSTAARADLTPSIIQYQYHPISDSPTTLNLVLRTVKSYYGIPRILRSESRESRVSTLDMCEPRVRARD
jgi:hypothetical protein